MKREEFKENRKKIINDIQEALKEAENTEECLVFGYEGKIFSSGNTYERCAILGGFIQSLFATGVEEEEIISIVKDSIKEYKEDHAEAKKELKKELKESLNELLDELFED